MKLRKVVVFLIILFSLFVFYAEENTSDVKQTEETGIENTTLQENTSQEEKDVTTEKNTTEENATETNLEKENNTANEPKESNENTKKSDIKTNKDKKTADNTKKSSPSVVTILSAQKTEYQKEKDTQADLIVLSGNVKLSVEKDGTKTIVSADTVTYERKRQRLFAQGSVVLEKMSGSKVTERLTAKSILFNSDTQEGIFHDGRVEQTDTDMVKLDTNSSLVVESDIFGRSSSGVIGFKNGSLSFCNEEDPHWHIDASRIWLLPGNEFAFANARFFVGNIFMLWLPFFYYPKDEMIFNPVLGYEDRKGYFLQTSTYLIGRKPLASSSSDEEDGYLDFLKPTKLKEQVREGLFLHNLEEDATSSTSNYLKIIADYYTNLGGIVGVDGNLKPKKVITELNFSALTGFSYTLYRNSSGYTPFNTDNNNEITQDNGYFLGYSLPFRFYVNLKTTISLSPFSLSLSVPIYSDSFFKDDFLTERTETMDWIGLLTSGLSDDTSTSTTTSGITSYTWSASASLTPSVSFLNPFVTTMSLTGLKSSILFNSKTNESLSGQSSVYSPNRKFFYPSQIVPFGGTFNLSGTIFSYPFKQKANKTTKKEEKNNSTLALIEKPKVLLDESKETKADDEIASTDKTPSKEETKIDEEKKLEQKSKEELENQMSPILSTSAYGSENSTFINYSLNYSIVPTYDSLITYNSNFTTSPEEISFAEENLQSSYYKISSPTQINSSLTMFNSALSVKNTLKFTPQYQEHPIISEEYYTTQSSRDQIVLNDYAAKSMNLENTNSISIQPLRAVPLFSTSSLTWNSTIKVIDTEFTGTIDEPEWEYKTPLWDEDGITTHTLNFDLVSRVNSTCTQTLSLITNLPPRLDTYTAKLRLVFPILTFSVESSIEKIDDDTNDDGIVDDNVTLGKHFDKFEFDPLKESLSLSLFNKKLTISQAFQYDIEEMQATSFSLSASMTGLSLAYSMAYTLPYKLTADRGWVAEDEKEFLPNSITLSYTLPTKKINLWKNRIVFNPGLSTSIKADMIKPTNSYFIFSPSITFSINEFLNLTFKSTSRNDVVFRYFQGLGTYDVIIPGETNMFQDLLNSFDFANEDNRELSGFKLKSFSLELTHDLHDWDVKSKFTIEPRLITDEIPYRYDFSPYFSISVVWKPMNAFKTEIEDEYGTVTLNP